jgi:cytochrome c-type biogenesis protein CcmH/NrfF
MKNSKALILSVLVLMSFMFLASGSVLAGFKHDNVFQQQEKTKVQKTEPEKEKQPEEKKEEADVDKAIEERLKKGESMFEILGIPSAEDYMPSTLDIFLLWLIPFLVIVAVVLLILVASRRRHQRILAMIEKGIIPDETALKEFKTTSFRWDVFLLLTGLILGLGGVGLSVFMMGHKGAQQWYTGVIPFLIGVALLVFYKIFYGKTKK